MNGDSPDFDAMLSKDLKERVALILSENPAMSPEAAMQKAQFDALANNPFRPPTHGCPVNDLPPELLAHIFQLGRKMNEEEEEYDEEYDDDDGVHLEDEWETDSEEGDADEVIDEDADVVMSSPVKGTVALPSPGAPPETDGEDSDSDSDLDLEDGEEHEEDVSDLAFQVLVSHVCRHWRDIALGTHTLWTTLQFSGHLNAEKAQAWLDRSNGLPLDIFIDCTTVHDPDHDHDGDEEAPDADAVGTVQSAASAAAAAFGIILSFDPATGTLTSSTTTEPPVLAEEPVPEPCITLDDLIVIMDMIIPHVQHWRIFEVTVSYYTYMYQVLSRVAQCPSAPLLEELGLYDYEDISDEYEVFQPPELATPFVPFHGIAPKLTNVAFWGVHIAWDDSLPLLKGLREIELAYHAKNVRPSFETFRAILDASPDLELLSLCLSGPTGDFEVIEVPSLRSLVLCYLENDFVKPLVQALVLPGLEELTLDFQQEDYSDFAKQLAGPARGQSRSLLAGLTSLKLTCLPCDDATSELFMAQLGGLKNIDLNCAEEDSKRYFELLTKMKGKPQTPSFCPKLETLRLAGLEGKPIRKLVAARKAAGAALQKVLVSDRDFVDPKDEKWLRANLDTFSFFEPSDSEDDAMNDEDMDQMTDDD
ncbi:hypothetical protein B0H17DRAFT_1209491 [Mycena rosella]|uniref:F-box domain-containing protein n=1 Tax=Mycena rosella TaxID=1033263 RepID=A0AAD7CYH3_MYCRO|nr:hypothetical protein B0H17DRAFT_1209491 [Mycena rosella]